MRYLLLGILGILTFPLQAQFTDSFSDGELDNNPKWIYNTSDFEVLSGRLKTLNSNGSAVKYGISTLANYDSAEIYVWEFQYGINPSSANYTEFWVNADTVVEKAKNGYFIRAGNTKDEISLYRMVNGTATEILSGTDGELNKTNSHYRVWLEKNLDSVSLYRKDLINNTTQKEGTIYLPDLKGGKYVGIHVIQNGTSAIGKHFFDNIYIGEKIKDTMAPRMVKAAFIYPNKISVTFNETIKDIQSQQFSLTVNGTSQGNPSVVFPDFASPEKCTLQFAQHLTTNVNCTLSNQGTPDIADNASGLHTINFISVFADTATLNDLIFTELMSVPAPSVGFLPEEEYLELYNRSNKWISLKNYKLSDRSSSVTLPDSVIPPQTYFTISKNTALKLDTLGVWVGVSTLPSLNNDNDYFTLFNHRGEKICAIEYFSSWHTDALKAKGGWSLERIDNAYYCINDNNWRSNQSNGGTPGQPNSVAGTITEPETFISHAYMPETDVTELYFSAPVDSASAFNLSNYSLISSGENPFRIAGISQDNTVISLKWLHNFIPNQIEKISINNLKSCGGIIFPSETVQVGRPDTSKNISKVFINEILFDPKEDGADYLEIYNAGNRIVDLKNTAIAGVNDTGTIASVSAFIENRLLLPGEYLVLTGNPSDVKKRYSQHNKRAFKTLPDLPTMSNDKGNIKLIDRTGKTLDSLVYEDDFHSPIISNKDGIALEKTQPDAPSNKRQYWTSATSSSGYGTPGMPNSQLSLILINAKRYFTLLTKVFTPNNDGDNDLLKIKCVLPEPGFWITMHIFNENGFPVANPFSNYSLGQNDLIQWDGNVDGNTIPAGNYVIKIEAFNQSGFRVRDKLNFSVNR
jgi:gliding motility-associated-like protein